MAGTKSLQHALAIGEALHQRFVDNQDPQLLKTMVDLYQSGKTLAEVSTEVGKPMVTVQRWLKNAGIERRIRGYGKKGQTWTPARRAKTPSAATIDRLVVDGVEIRGQQILTHRALGNKSITPQGYVVVHVGVNQRQYEYILVAEQAIGRPLADGEVVHHINCVRSENCRSNLLVCTHTYHMALHARMRRDPYWREVERAGKAKSIQIYLDSKGNSP